jgi:uncharacterized protein
MAPLASTMLEKNERTRLLVVARCSIASGLGRVSPERMPEGAWPSRLLEPRATFTTLTLDGKLRGCCGTIEPRRPLVDDVWHNAWVSAFADPRFLPVAAGELVALEISISVLTPLEPIAASSEAELIASLQPGVDGVVISCGDARATFLPEVWQSLPEPDEFVAHLKRKAGLSGSRLSSRTRAFRYRTESFQSSHGFERAA